MTSDTAGSLAAGVLTVPDRRWLGLDWSFRKLSVWYRRWRASTVWGGPAAVRPDR